MKKHTLTVILSFVLIAAVIGLSPHVSKAADLITGRSIADNTIQATDLGTDVTRVKSASITLKPSDATWDCPDEDVGVYETCFISDPGLGAQRYTVSCPSGNVTGGGVRPLDIDSGYYVEIHGSYPSTDASWTFELYNAGPDPIPVQLRVLCI